MGKQLMMYGADIQLERLSKLGDPLEKLNAAVDWEIFRKPIRSRVRKEDYSKGGRPPKDEIMMFKITLLQDWNNISDDNAENDHLLNSQFCLYFQLNLQMALVVIRPVITTVINIYPALHKTLHLRYLINAIPPPANPPPSKLTLL